MPALAGVDYGGEYLEAQRSLKRYRAWVLAELAPYIGETVAEIGAGLGSYTEALLEFAQRLDLVEPSRKLLPKLTRRFGDADKVTVFPETAETWLRRMPENTYDTLVMINVLEHIKDDSEVLHGVFRVLRPGGHVVLFVPALPFLFSPVDRLVGHYRRYRIEELKARTRTAGFEIVMARYFDLLGVVPWWIVHTVMGVTRFHGDLLAVYDSIGVPTTRLLERLIAPPIGKNVVLAAQRPKDPASDHDAGGAAPTREAEHGRRRLQPEP